MARRGPVGDQIVKLLVGAGQASPSPPVGPALGSKGVKSMDFCKEFNARTAQYTPGTPIPALVTVRPDRSFTFQLRTPPTATLLLAAAGVNPIKNKTRGAGNTAGPKRISSEVATLAGAFAREATSSGVGGSAAAAEAGKGAEKGDGAVQVKGKDTRERYKVEAKGKAGGKDIAGNGGLGTVGTVSLKHVYEIAKIKSTEARLGGLTLEGIAKSVVAQAGSMGVVVVP